MIKIYPLKKCIDITHFLLISQSIKIKIRSAKETLSSPLLNSRKSPIDLIQTKDSTTQNPNPNKNPFTELALNKNLAS